MKTLLATPLDIIFFHVKNPTYMTTEPGRYKLAHPLGQKVLWIHDPRTHALEPPLWVLDLYT